MTKNRRQKKCTFFTGRFDGYDDVPVRCQLHRQMQHVQGYLRCDWTPPLGRYLPHIALVDAMIINFGLKNRAKDIGYRSKGTKRTLYSAYKSDKLRRKVKHHG